MIRVDRFSSRAVRHHLLLLLLRRHARDRVVAAWIVFSFGLAAILSVALGVTAIAQERDTLETRLTVEGSEVIFRWSKKHPWDLDIIERGASLYAEYRDDRDVVGSECVQGGRVVETGGVTMGAATSRRGSAVMRGTGGCYSGNAAIRRDDRIIHFQLPGTLAAEPAGPVCLVLRLPDGRVLPVRRAGKRGDDTARFQVEAWANAAASRKRAENLQMRRKELEAALATQTAAVTDQERSNAGRGWRSAEACQTITAAPLAIAGSNRPLAPPDRQDAVARQVCISRVFEGRAAARQVSPPDDLQAWLERLPQGDVQQWITLRGAQWRQFHEDWARFAPTRAAYVKQHPVPHFGTHGDRLSLQSLAFDAYKAISQRKPTDPPPDAWLVFGYFGSKLEAYDRCVTDGLRQLDLNYREAAALKSTLAAMPERLRDQEIKSCLGGMVRLAAMRTRIATLEQDLSHADIEIKTLTAAVPRPIARRELNDVSCTP